MDTILIVAEIENQFDNDRQNLPISGAITEGA
jgi:hypothetical protein